MKIRAVIDFDFLGGVCDHAIEAACLKIIDDAVVGFTTIIEGISTIKTHYDLSVIKEEPEDDRGRRG